MKYLVEQVHVNVQNKNKEGFGAAWIAAHRGKLEVVEYLLDNKLFDVNETLMVGSHFEFAFNKYVEIFTNREAFQFCIYLHKMDIFLW